MAPSSPLIWIDLEMSGLNPEQNTILEIALIITDAELETIAEGPTLAIHQPESVLAAMDQWNTEHHTASGLVKRVRESTVSMQQTEETVLEFLEQHTTANESPLCGNSIYMDRLFLRRYMPRLEAHFHYRNIDVSSIKELVRRWYPESMQAPAKKNAHRALDDINESIAELRYYRNAIFVARR